MKILIIDNTIAVINGNFRTTFKTCDNWLRFPCLKFIFSADDLRGYDGVSFKKYIDMPEIDDITEVLKMYPELFL